LWAVLDRARRLWRDKIAGPTLRTYDAACEELGGEPWRELPEATDRWFLADRPKSLVSRPDSADFDLRRHMSDATKLALLAGAALLVIIGVVAALALPSVQPTRPPAPMVTSAPAPTIAEPSLIAPPPGAAPPAASPRHFAHRRRR
jgi:hypothetical protein